MAAGAVPVVVLAVRWWFLAVPAAPGGSLLELANNPAAVQADTYMKVTEKQKTQIKTPDHDKYNIVMNSGVRWAAVAAVPRRAAAARQVASKRQRWERAKRQWWRLAAARASPRTPRGGNGGRRRS